MTHSIPLRNGVSTSDYRWHKTSNGYVAGTVVEDGVRKRVYLHRWLRFIPRILTGERQPLCHSDRCSYEIYYIMKEKKLPHQSKIAAPFVAIRRKSRGNASV